MAEKVECANCTKLVCDSAQHLDGPSNCPTRIKQNVIKRALVEYERLEIREFARQASVQEFECYLDLPEGKTPRHPRVEEIAQFAKKMGYKKLGITYLYGSQERSQIVDENTGEQGF